MNLPLPKPAPDAQRFIRTILRQEVPHRVPFFELKLDTEIMRDVLERQLAGRWVDPVDESSRQQSLRNCLEIYHRLGYDCLRFSTAYRFSSGLVFSARARHTADTAVSGKERKWAEQGAGLIASWEDFEKYPWPSPSSVDMKTFEFISAQLPEGMGFFVDFCQGYFELAANSLLGFQNLSLLLYDNPQLVQAVVDRAGSLMFGCFERVIGLPGLVGFFQGDDMGFKTGTLVSPPALRQYFLPWHKKAAALAHRHGLVYFLHSCGCLDAIMEDLIEDVRIDAKHSFEDAILPVGDFKERYGSRIGVLGGVDVDKLCRLAEPELRRYVRGILERCMPGGGYALGSGNSVANYVPIEKYLVMLDEGRRYGI